MVLQIERDLHDGVQQQLVALAMALRRAGSDAEMGSEAGLALRHGADEALIVVEEGRELARRIHPAMLTEAGLTPALQALADRSPVPVELEVDLDTEVSGTAAATAYFVASEALANIAKHAGATTIRLRARTDGGRLTIRIDDDGVGGADASGSGLRGLADRVAASGGTFRVEAGSGGGSSVSAVLLRHASSKTTMEIYSHVSAAQQREAVEVLQRALAESHIESHPTPDLGGQDWAKAAGNGQVERESGSGGPEPATYCVRVGRPQPRSRSRALLAPVSG